MKQLQEDGFAILPNILTKLDIETINQLIDEADTNNPNFRRSKDLFAIRQFISQIPEIAKIILQSGLSDIIKQNFGEDYFIVKSIYFDKPPASNWFVSYHQDLTISVKEKIPTDGFGPWTTKEGQFAVQPTIIILEDNITVRIHLDDTTADNGALKVVPGSHLKGIYRPETIDWSMEREVTCEVPKGGAMIMKPLLLHASGRTTNNNRRRVIHVEFSRSKLPNGLEWAEAQ